MEFEQAIQQLSLVYPHLTICVFADREHEKSCYDRWKRVNYTKDNEETLPINPELVQDWLFCHDHSPDNVAHKGPVCLDAGLLTTIKQVNKLLIQSHAEYPDEYIFENQDKTKSVYVSVQNSSWYFCQALSGTENASSLPKSTLRLIKASYLHYKVFYSTRSNEKTDLVNCTEFSQLKELRLSFNVDWFRVSNEVSDRLIEILDQSNEHLKNGTCNATTTSTTSKKMNQTLDLKCGFIAREDIATHPDLDSIDVNNAQG